MTTVRNLLSLFILICLSIPSWADTAALTTIGGTNILDGKKVEVSAKDAGKGLVLIFLSAKCPCSNSHLVELKALAKDYPDFRFVGVHSNRDEAAKFSETYFQAQDLPFPIVQDEKAKVADAFRAYKTPHAFLILPDGSVVYRGGVTSSRYFSDKADHKFLREAIDDVAHARPVRTPEGRTLGCMISREGSDS